MLSIGKLEGRPKFQGHTSAPVGRATKLIYARKSGSTLYNNYNEFQSKFSGAVQITCGILLILTNIILLVTDHLVVNVIGHGIWGGVILVVSGSVGIVASKRKTKCLAITYMILCIVSSMLSILVLVFAGFGLDSVVWNCRESFVHRHPWSSCNYGPEFAEAFHSLIVVFTILGGISAIWGSTLCCKAAACCSDGNEELVPMQIVTADGNQKALHGNSANDYMKPSELEGYEKLHQDTGDEVYDTIEDDDVKDAPDISDSGYERCQRPATTTDNDNIQQNNYDKINHVIEENADSQGVAGYNKLVGCPSKTDDYVRYEKPVHDYLVLEAEKD